MEWSVNFLAHGHLCTHKLKNGRKHPGPIFPGCTEHQGQCWLMDGVIYEPVQWMRHGSSGLSRICLRMTSYAGAPFVRILEYKVVNAWIRKEEIRVEMSIK